MELLQPELFDESEIMRPKLYEPTPEETKLLNAPREKQLEYLRNFFLAINPDERFEEIKVYFYKHINNFYDNIVSELIRNVGIIDIFEIQVLILSQEQKIEYAIDRYVDELPVDMIADILKISKPQVYKWLRENKKEVLQRTISHCIAKIKEYELFENYQTPEEQKTYLLTELENNVSIDNIAQDLSKAQNYVVTTSEHAKDILKYRAYKTKLAKAEKELRELEDKEQRKEIATTCTTSTSIPNDIVVNDFYDLLTYYDDLPTYAERQSKKSHSLELKTKDKGNVIRLQLIKDDTKNLILQMNKPNDNVNMLYMRDLYVLSMQALAKMDKESLTRENLQKNPITIKLSTIDIQKNSNYKNLNDVQKMSSDEFISQLGSLAIFGKSYIYQGKGKNKTQINATEDTEIQKKYIPMFKEVGYENNTIGLVLNDRFPWESFTLHYFTLLPDNYLKLSEQAKTLLMYLCTLPRINGQTKFTICYTELVTLLKLKDYEQDKKHATDRIITPIHKAIEEVNKNNSYFFCIDEEKNLQRTPKEIIENGRITVKLLNTQKDFIESLNKRKQKKIDNSIKRRKKKDS